jgi:hypothetical protein
VGRHGAWLAAGALVVLGWASGYAIWTPEAPGGPYGEYFDARLPAETLVVGIPLVVAAALMLGRPGSFGGIGYALLTLAALALGGLASFAFFGGFCLDENDVCVTTWPSRAAELLVALACVALGWLVHGWAARRRSLSGA